MAKKKFYVVWNGVNPGIYDSWEEAKVQINGYENAQYKSFEDEELAIEMYARGYKYYKKHSSAKNQSLSTSKSNPIKNSICVDAACSGNPGVMEYRGVKTITKKEIFRMGPFDEATNNIGEFLAIVHAAALLKKHNAKDTTIYTDSKTAMAWIRNKKVKTTLAKTDKNKKVWELIDRAYVWLHNNTIENPIVKWPTKEWGEIPADFGRK